MPDQEKKDQTDFMIEKIKARPVNKKKLLRRMLLTAAMAVIFGLVACLTFLLLEPVLSNWLYPEEEPQAVTFPEDQEEMLPEDMLLANLSDDRLALENPPLGGFSGDGREEGSSLGGDSGGGQGGSSLGGDSGGGQEDGSPLGGDSGGGQGSSALGGESGGGQGGSALGGFFGGSQDGSSLGGESGGGQEGGSSFGTDLGAGLPDLVPPLEGGSGSEGSEPAAGSGPEGSEPAAGSGPEGAEQAEGEPGSNVEQAPDQASGDGSEGAGEGLSQEQIDEILSGVTLDLQSCRQLYGALSDYIAKLQKYMVTVSGVNSAVDWFSNTYESSTRTSGVVIGTNGKEILILTDYSSIRSAQRLTVTFSEGTRQEAQIKQYHSGSNLAILCVNINQTDSEFIENELKIAPLGSSNLSDLLGSPVIAMGSPMGTEGSVGYGMITSTDGQITLPDANYKLLTTDIYGSQKATGVLFNLQGQVIGFVSSSHTAPDADNLIVAAGISDLKKVINRMTKGSKIPYLGIGGVDVTEDANRESQVPFGAYVREVEAKSPAMLAGIQRGDIITGVGDKTISRFAEYTDALYKAEVEESLVLKVMRLSQGEYREMEFEITLEEAD